MSETKMDTLISGLRELATQAPHVEMMVTYSEDMTRRALTRQQLFNLASKFAHVLKKQGVERGDVVTNTLPTSLESAVVIFGTILAGAVAVTVDVVTQSGEELFHALNKSKCRVLISRTDQDDHVWSLLRSDVSDSDSNIHKIKSALAPTLSNVIVADRDQVDYLGCNFLEQLKMSSDSYIDDAVAPADPAMIFLTSGTTGFPKLAVYSHGGVVADARNGSAALEIEERSKFYIATSWSWGVSSPVDLLCGLTRVTADLWQKLQNPVKHHVQVVKHEKVNSAFLSPALVDKMLAICSHDDTCMFDQLFVVGVPVNHTVCRRLLTATRLLTVRYSSTENICIVYNHVRDITEFQDYDCGIPYPGCRVRIVDDTNTEVPLGAPGRILVKTEGIFDGYLNDPEKTSKAMLEGGWYNSSDAGYIRSYDEHLVVIGRYDYIIMHNSVHIYPAWIERPIRAHPEVAEVVVVPVPDDVNYQNICACVIKKPGSKLTAQCVIDIIQGKFTDGSKELLAPHFVLFYESFPSNARGKIVMNKLIEDAVSRIKNNKFIQKNVCMG